MSCALARVEVLRAVRPHGSPAVERARQLFERTSLLRLDDALLDAAALVDPAGRRSLDAIHLAAAQMLGDELSAIVTYDTRMAESASALGLPVAAPVTGRR